MSIIEKIYSKLLKVLENIEGCVKKIKEKLRSKINIDCKKNIYSDLMPKEDVDKVKTYHEALDWAINENVRIKNIALSGSYGSGKSTIIESYIKKDNKRKGEFLKISLATFDESKVEQELIEKSILEQMIYRIDGKKTPFSRFKKINKISIQTVWKSVAIGIVFSASGWLLHNISVITKGQKLLINYQEIMPLIKENWLMCVIGTIFIITSIRLLYNLIKLILKSFKIAKITFADTEIEAVGDNDESIYNKYLDELLYFFEETSYEIVIFEDIDRFENSAIFTNLREINTFLNNYEKINRRIIFLYAIKDDVFSNKERTKFFDFIIPVIPFVDAFNSRQIVINKFDGMNGMNIKRPSEKLIKDITIFLDDMRMLTNIINEYVVYYKQIDNEAIDADKLFSIIVYKNLLPKDFSKLQYNKGIVKKVFDKKIEFVTANLEKVEEDIQRIKKLIELSDSMIMNSIGEILVIFKFHWDKKSITTVDGVHINEDLVQYKKNFEGKKEIRVYIQNRGYERFSYDEIFTAFGQHDNFFVMTEAVELQNKEKLQKKKKELEDYLSKKNELSLISLKELVKDYDANEIFDEIKEEELLVFLIREGYIDETYRHYMSYFYPGAITHTDMTFLRSTKNQRELGFEFKLDKINEIIQDISSDEFKSTSILNNDLIDHLLDHQSNEKGRLCIVIEGIIKNMDSRIDFIDQFFQKSKHKETFINEICKKNNGFWDFIMNKFKAYDDKIDDYFTCIINACDVEVIIGMNLEKNIKNFIETRKHIFQMKYKVNIEDKLKTIIGKLNVKFVSLEKPKIEFSDENKEKSEHKLIMYILENAMFQINENMIRYFYEYLTKLDEEKIKEFEFKNYSSIKRLGNESLSKYIDGNLERYLTEVFLKLPRNTDEDILVIEDFLKNEEIDKTIRFEIINKSKMSIKNLKSIPDYLWNEIIECDKWDITWFNIICYFVQFSKLNDKIIENFNKYEIFTELSTTRINEIDDIKEQSDESYEELYQYLYENERLNNECFEKIIQVIPNYYNYSEEVIVSTERMKLILDNGCIEFSVEDLKHLKNHYGDLYYDWSINNFDKFLENTNEISTDNNEIKMYLMENKINTENKIKLININKESVLNNFDDPKLVKGMFKLNDEIAIEKLDDSIFEQLMNLDDYKDERVRLLVSKVQFLDTEGIRNYLSILGEPLNLLFEEDYEEGDMVLIKRSDVVKCILEKLVEYEHIKSFDASGRNYKIKY